MIFVKQAIFKALFVLCKIHVFYIYNYSKTALTKMAIVEKLWNQRGRPRNGCDGVGWLQKF